jgi:hypothetical protein
VATARKISADTQSKLNYKTVLQLYIFQTLKSDTTMRKLEDCPNCGERDYAFAATWGSVIAESARAEKLVFLFQPQNLEEEFFPLLSYFFQVSQQIHNYYA